MLKLNGMFVFVRFLAQFDNFLIVSTTLLAGLAFLECLAVGLFTPYKPDWSEYYFLCLVSLVFLSSLHGLYQQVSQRGLMHESAEPDSAFASQVFRRPDLLHPLLIIIAAVVIWFIWRQPILLQFPLWHDEATQFLGFDNGAGAAMLAATQQQPPLGYFFSRFAREFIGVSEFSVLLHAYIFSVAGYVLFVFWLIRNRCHFLLALPLLLLFASHFVLLNYTSEARPVALAVFSGMLYLFVLVATMQARISNPGALFAATVLHLVSIGMQPVFLVFTAALACLPFLRFLIMRKRVIQVLLYGAVLPALFYAPVFLRSYLVSKGMGKFDSAGLLQSIGTGLVSLQWSSFYRFFVNFAKFEIILVVPVALLIAVILQFLQQRVARQKQTPESYFALSLCLSISYLFPLLFVIVWSAVNWPLHAHYIAVWTAGLFCTIVLAATDSLKFLQYRRKPVQSGQIQLNLPAVFSAWLRATPFRWPLLAASTASLAVTIYISSVFAPHHLVSIAAKRSISPDWRIITEVVEKNRRGRALILEVPLTQLGAGIHHYYTGYIYQTPSIQVRTMYQPSNVTGEIKLPFNICRIPEIDSENFTDLFLVVYTAYGPQSKQYDKWLGKLATAPVRLITLPGITRLLHLQPHSSAASSKNRKNTAVQTGDIVALLSDILHTYHSRQRLFCPLQALTYAISMQPSVKTDPTFGYAVSTFTANERKAELRRLLSKMQSLTREEMDFTQRWNHKAYMRYFDYLAEKLQ